MSAHHPHTFDPRTVSPLACCDSAGDLSTHPKDSLHRVAITLELLSDLIGNGKGESQLPRPKGRSLRLHSNHPLLSSCATIG